MFHCKFWSYLWLVNISSIFSSEDITSELSLLVTERGLSLHSLFVFLDVSSLRPEEWWLEKALVLCPVWTCFTTSWELEGKATSFLSFSNSVLACLQTSWPKSVVIAFLVRIALTCSDCPEVEMRWFRVKNVPSFWYSELFIWSVASSVGAVFLFYQVLPLANWVIPGTSALLFLPMRAFA